MNVLPNETVNVTVNLTDAADGALFGNGITHIGWRVFNKLKADGDIANGGIGEKPTCVSMNEGIIGNDGLSLTFGVEMSIAPAGPSNLYLRLYNGGCDSNQAWTGDGGPKPLGGKFNLARVAKDQIYTTPVNTLFSIDVEDILDPARLTDISDGEDLKDLKVANPVLLVGSNGGALGEAVINDGEFKYTPPSATFRGVDIIKYHINAGNLNPSDGGRDHDGIITMFVSPQQDEPVGDFDLSAFGAENSGADVVLTTKESVNLNFNNVSVVIPTGTTMTVKGAAGQQEPSVVIELNIENPSNVHGAPNNSEMAISVGVPDTEITFSHAVKLVFPGKAGKRVGWTREGSGFTEITATCNSATPTLGAGADCKRNEGSNLVVWTRHFTTFVVYPALSVSSGGGSSSGGVITCAPGQTSFCRPATATASAAATTPGIVSPGTPDADVATLLAQLQAMLPMLSQLGITLPAEIQNLLASSSSAGAVPVPATCKATVVRVGSRGACVTALQSALSISADGIFGQQTAATVRAFQQSKNISVDGIVGPQTWNLL